MMLVAQSVRDGAISVLDAPEPRPGPGEVLIRTRKTLLSSGTERALLDFGKASLLGKARREPERLRDAFAKARTDGVLATLGAVRSRLDRPHAPGYCNVGTVVALGAGVEGLEIGSRVASNGGHAEFVAVGRNLCAPVPDAVSDEDAAFTVLGAVALQAVRLAEPTLGEAVTVFGLGPVGLLALQLLQANGARVLALDLDPARLALARSLGAETFDLSNDADPEPTALAFSRGRGIDAVLLATATRSEAPLRQAARVARRRGRVVLAGTAGMTVPRAPFFEKELSFRVSCSYGPGRYDQAYERGHDYPVGFVRWTAARNFEAVLDTIAAGRIQTAPLVSHRFSAAEAPRAYAVLGGSEPSLGILLDFGTGEPKPAKLPPFALPAQPRAPTRPRIGLIGAGAHALAALLPALHQAGADLTTVASRKPIDAAHAARKFGFRSAATDPDAILSDPAIDAVVIATRHDSHARLSAAALSAGKHVFTEKPLALDEAELALVETAWRGAQALPRPPTLTVGFNRRFAPHAQALRTLLAARSEPKSFIYTVNAGPLPPAHWAHADGGRLIGEACHFIDLLRFLAGAPILQQQSLALGAPTRDTATLSLAFADGSIGTIHYHANGARHFPKERLEVFCGGGILRLDNFRSLSAWNWPRPVSRLWRLRPDKGHAPAIESFLRAAGEGGPPPIPFDEILEVSRSAIRLREAAA
ncbi:MAG: dehydrogenase [Mesorhizobium amorphae]|nr:MAG: dehydrogenase [Mesorhizobium amorphae]